MDIDTQAVEVAQLSLYLKLLEDETPGSTRAHQQSLGGALLPSLSKNIVSGNALIGTDFVSGKLFTLEEDRKYNVMDFERHFTEIMKDGGFDAIVGNPPYGAEISRDAVSYLRAKFNSTTKDLDTYAAFMEQAVKLTKPVGLVSMIVPTGWYSGAKFGALRRFIARTTNPRVFVNLPYDVFDAWVDTTVFVAEKRREPTSWMRTDACEVSLRTFPKKHKITSEIEFGNELDKADFLAWFTDESDGYLTYANTATTLLMRKIVESSKPLQNYADVQRGVTPYNLDKTALYATSRLAFDGVVRLYTFEQGEVRFIRFDESLAEFKPERYFQGQRLLLRELISRQFQLQAVKVTEDFVTNKSMQSTLQLPGAPDLSYILGVLNSRLMSWYFMRRSNIAQRDDFPKIVLKETRFLPIPSIELENTTDKARHDRVVQLVEAMLATKQQPASARTDADINRLAHRAADLDRRIDELVYELYALTAEEIVIVEGSA